MYKLNSPDIIDVTDNGLDLELICNRLHNGNTSPLYKLDTIQPRYLSKNWIDQFVRDIRSHYYSYMYMMGVNYDTYKLDQEYVEFKIKVYSIPNNNDNYPLLVSINNRKIKLFKYLRSIKPDFMMTELYDLLLNDLQNKVQDEIKDVVYFDFTSNINWDSGDFGDDGSCYWSMSSRAAARPSLENDDKFMAIRFFTHKQDNCYKGIGRTWILLNRLNNKYTIPVTAFNFYYDGYHENYSDKHNWSWFRAIMDKVLGAGYKNIKLDAYNSNDYDNVIYINSDRAYCWIDKNKNQDDLNRVDLNVEILDGYDLIDCYHCSNQFTEDEGYYIESYDITVCEYCYNNRYFTCDNCGMVIRNSEQNIIHSGEYICNECLQSGDYFECEDCNEIFHYDNGTYIENLDISVCEDCYSNYKECDFCGDIYNLDDLNYVDSRSEYICDTCKKDHFIYCVTCNELTCVTDITTSLECLSCADSPRLTITNRQLFLPIEA